MGGKIHPKFARSMALIPSYELYHFTIVVPCLPHEANIHRTFFQHKNDEAVHKHEGF